MCNLDVTQKISWLNFINVLTCVCTCICIYTCIHTRTMFMMHIAFIIYGKFVIRNFKYFFSCHFLRIIWKKKLLLFSFPQDAVETLNSLQITNKTFLSLKKDRKNYDANKLSYMRKYIEIIGMTVSVLFLFCHSLNRLTIC